MTAQTSLVYLNYDLRADGDEKKKKLKFMSLRISFSLRLC